MSPRFAMDTPLNSALATAKQAYEELIGLVSLEQLARHEFGLGARRDRVEDLLKILNREIVAVRRGLASHVSESDVPVLQIPEPHRKFYSEVLGAHGELLRRAHLEIEGGPDLTRFCWCGVPPA